MTRIPLPIPLDTDIHFDRTSNNINPNVRMYILQCPHINQTSSQSHSEAKSMYALYISVALSIFRHNIRANIYRNTDSPCLEANSNGLTLHDQRTNGITQVNI